ncbi:MAG: hypothetical protein QW041_01630 [Candidatus Pacearchaeota archaeon]
MISDINIGYGRKKYKMTSKQAQGTGVMYIFSEIKSRNKEAEELSNECKIFQVYRYNGKIKIDAYNQSNHLVSSLEKLIKRLNF